MSNEEIDETGHGEYDDESISAPVTSFNKKEMETMIVVESPELDQETSSQVRPGTCLEYTDKDSGRELPPFVSKDKSVHRDEGLVLTPGTKVTVGEDITIDLARRLASRGYLKIVGE